MTNQILLGLYVYVHEQASVNVPALSDQRDIAAGNFKTGPDVQMSKLWPCLQGDFSILLLQMEILKRLATQDPSMGWWIKGDGTDAVKGLWESVS